MIMHLQKPRWEPPVAEGALAGEAIEYMPYRRFCTIASALQNTCDALLFDESLLNDKTMQASLSSRISFPASCSSDLTFAGAYPLIDVSVR